MGGKVEFERIDIPPSGYDRVTMRINNIRIWWPVVKGHLEWALKRLYTDSEGNWNSQIHCGAWQDIACRQQNVVSLREGSKVAASLQSRFQLADTIWTAGNRHCQIMDPSIRMPFFILYQDSCIIKRSLLLYISSHYRGCGNVVIKFNVPHRKQVSILKGNTNSEHRFKDFDVMLIPSQSGITKNN